jgi:hypothetical protein
MNGQLAIQIQASNKFTLVEKNQLVTSTMNCKSCKLLKGWIIYLDCQTLATLTPNNDLQGLHITYQ